jgi:protein ImuB
MTIAHARALLPAPEPAQRGAIDTLQRFAGDDHAGGASGLVVEHDPDRDRRALDALAHWALRFTPIVQPDHPSEYDHTFGLLLDITGCEGVFHTHRRHLNAAANAAEWMGITVRAAVAPTPIMARAAARFGPLERCIVRPERLDEALDALPVRALRIAEAPERALHELGVDTIGQLRALPRHQLPSRFGDDLLYRLDQAAGRRPDPLDPVKPAPPPVAERAFDGPTRSQEGIRRAVDDLLGRLCDELLHRQQGALRIEIVLTRSDAPPTGFDLTLSSPSRNATHLRSLARPLVERANLGFGVDRLTAAAPRVMPLPHEQHARWQSDRGSAAQQRRLFGELVDTLASRLGADRVTQLETTPSHDPHRAVRRVPACDGTQAHGARENNRSQQHRGARQTMLRDAAGSSPSGARHDAKRHRPTADGPRDPRERDAALHERRDRPTLLLARPERVQVIATTPDGPPHRVRWRSDEHDIIAAAGPERLIEEWWRDDNAAGDWIDNMTRTGADHSDTIRESLAPPSLEREAAKARVLNRDAAADRDGQLVLRDATPNAHAVRAGPPSAADAEAVANANDTHDVHDTHDADGIDWEIEAARVALTGADYFRVQLSTGLWLWLARTVHSSTWFVRGLWA